MPIGIGIALIVVGGSAFGIIITLAYFDRKAWRARMRERFPHSELFK